MSISNPESAARFVFCALSLLVALHYAQHCPTELRRLRAYYRRAVESCTGRFRTLKRLAIEAGFFSSATLLIAPPVLYLAHAFEPIFLVPGLG